MISLQEHRVALINLPGTIAAMEKLEQLIDYYGQNKPGPAYLTCRYAPNEPEIQVGRKLFLNVLQQQHAELVRYLGTLGIDAGQ